MKARAYVGGKPIELDRMTNPGSAILEVELNDGRTVQLCVNKDGGICLRGWGNIPATVGNSNSIVLTCELKYEEPTTCDRCYNQFEKCDCITLRE